MRPPKCSADRGGVIFLSRCFLWVKIPIVNVRQLFLLCMTNEKTFSNRLEMHTMSYFTAELTIHINSHT